jgi:arginine decarboxylase-like protein
MKKLQNEYLSLAIGTSISTFGNVNTPFVKAFLMGHIIGKSGRDITESEMEFINSIELIDYDLQSEGEDETEQIKSLIENYIDENGSISQEQIDEFIWDVIGELDNSDELFEEICNNGAFGSYES